MLTQAGGNCRESTAQDPSGEVEMMNMIGMVRVSLMAAAILTTAAANAQQWPTRTIRVVVPLSAGSAVDITPRVVFEDVATELGQSIVIENRTGASGTIGTRSVATSPPDGYTLLAHSSALVVSPLTVANAHYDPIKDFVPIAPLGELPNVLVVAPEKNIHNVQEFVANAKKKPITYGAAGIGTPVYLAMEKFRLATGFQGNFIPFRGAPEVTTEVLTGRLDAYYAPLSAVLEFIRSGKLVALCVSSSQRSAALPDVPTSLEAGYPNSDLSFWIGAFAPAGTPPEIVEKINHAITTALTKPSLREKLAKQGVEPMVMTSAQFAQLVKNEVTSMAMLAKELNLTPQ